MEIHRKDFPKIMLDNDEIFIDNIIGLTESVDELCSMEITKKEKNYHFRVAPSVPKYIEPILYEILTFSNMFGLKLELSKSMKASSTVTFDIEL